MKSTDEKLRDDIAKAIADVIGHGMREKCYAQADAVLSILDVHPVIEWLNVRITADDIHWFEPVFRAWEASDWDGTIDGLNAAIASLVEKTSARLTSSMPSAREGRGYEQLENTFI